MPAHFPEIGIENGPGIGAEPFDVDVMPALLSLAVFLLEDRVGFDRMGLEYALIARERGFERRGRKRL
jgi:hypothetical protein